MPSAWVKRAVWLATVGLLVTMAFEYGMYVTSQAAAERLAESTARINAMGARIDALVGTAGRPGDLAVSSRADRVAQRVAVDRAVVDTLRSQLQRELGILPVSMVRERRASFAELYATDASGGNGYGTAGALGDGYFITVKHGVMALGIDARDPGRRIRTIRLKANGLVVRARVVDAGDAESEVDPGDWAILRTVEELPLPALRPRLDYTFPFADPIVRLGNDYSKGVIAATGSVGEYAGGLVTCLTDGHPGVSGGGVLDQDGALVGIPVGRMQGDYRFSFILPLRGEMFRKVPHLRYLADNPPPQFAVEAENPFREPALESAGH